MLSPQCQHDRHSSRAMAAAVAGDRIWFERNPRAMVRLRREQPGEFEELLRDGKQPPCFIPSGFKPETRLNWVAVVHLCRLIEGHRTAEEESIRLRIKTIAARSKKNQSRITEELIEAVAAELLDLMAANQPKHSSEGPMTPPRQIPA